MAFDDPVRVPSLYNTQRGGFPSLTPSAMPANVMPGDQPMPAPPPMPGQKPSAWGKGGRAWQIMGIIGDALQTAGGGKGTFMPAFLDMQEQTRKERETLTKLQAQQAAIAGLGLTPQQGAAVQAGVANYSDFKPSNAQPYRWEDNAGNVWERGSDGSNQRIFTDKVPKYYVQGDKAVLIDNPYAGEGGAGGGIPKVSDAAGYDALQPGQQYYDPSGALRTKGGAASNGGGNFSGR